MPALAFSATPMPAQHNSDSWTELSVGGRLHHAAVLPWLMIMSPICGNGSTP